MKSSRLSLVALALAGLGLSAQTAPDGTGVAGVNIVRALTLTRTSAQINGTDLFFGRFMVGGTAGSTSNVVIDSTGSRTPFATAGAGATVIQKLGAEVAGTDYVAPVYTIGGGSQGITISMTVKSPATLVGPSGSVTVNSLSAIPTVAGNGSAITGTVAGQAGTWTFSDATGSIGFRVYGSIALTSDLAAGKYVGNYVLTAIYN